MKILFALAGLHRFDRGAEIAFISVADELAKSGEDVTLIGSGPPREGATYAYFRAPCFPRTRFEDYPPLPFLRHEYAYEELTFAPSLLSRYWPADYDVTVTCSYPYTNWLLRRPALHGARPPHVFVTQNGDWPAYANTAEYRFFGCEGLVCTNPDYFERNKQRWNCCLIPNGVDIERFVPGPPQRDAFGLPSEKTLVLMVSALIDSKRVEAGIEAVSRLADAHLVVTGDGPLRQRIPEKAASLLQGRFTILSLPAEQMPVLYRSADVFLHMSLEEAFGNVFIEALACGLPVVGHESPRLRWIVGEHGFLVDTNEPGNVASAITSASTRAIAKREDRIAWAANFSWKRVGQAYRDFLQSVVAESRAGKRATPRRQPA